MATGSPHTASCPPHNICSEIAAGSGPTCMLMYHVELGTGFGNKYIKLQRERLYAKFFLSRPKCFNSDYCSTVNVEQHVFNLYRELVPRVVILAITRTYFPLQTEQAYLGRGCTYINSHAYLSNTP